jgi:hypothetical protein
MPAMFYRLYINPSWIVSPFAKKVYSVSALVALFCWIGVLVPATVAIAVAGNTLYDSPLLVLTLETVMFIGVLGAATVWAGMWYFWFKFHDGNTVSSALWFIALVLLGPVASLTYFAVVYRRSPVFAAAK